MKRNVLIAALCAVALVLAMGCSEELVSTSPDLTEFNKQYEAGHTDNKGSTILTSFAECFTTASWSVTPPASGNAATMDVFVDFSRVTDGTKSIDVLGETTAFESKLKEIVTFYRYTSLGTFETKVPGSTASLDYSVVDYAGYRARLRFAIDLTPTTGTSSAIEMRINPDKFTHHNGQKVDYNNDGKVDEYDTYITKISLTGSTGDVNSSSSYIAKDYQYGLLNSNSYNFTPDDSDDANYTLTLEVTQADTGDYASKLNEVFKLQEFTEANGWKDTGTAGTYSTTDKTFKFTIAKTTPPKVYHIRFDNYNAARTGQWTAAAEVYGVKQQLFGIWSTDVISGAWIVDPMMGFQQYSVIVEKTALAPNNYLTTQISSSPFGSPSVSKDATDTNVSVEVSIDLGGVGNLGLPSPQDALNSGILRIGYLADGDINTGDWNSIVFFPKSEVTITAYRKDNKVGTADDPAPDNYWRITLPPAYKVNEKEKFLFFTPDFVSNGNKVTAPADPQKKYFGNYANTYAIADEGGTKRAFFGTFSLGTDF